MVIRIIPICVNGSMGSGKSSRLVFTSGEEIDVQDLLRWRLLVLWLWENRLRSPSQDIRHFQFRRNDINLQALIKRGYRRQTGSRRGRSSGWGWYLRHIDERLYMVYINQTCIVDIAHTN